MCFALPLTPAVYDGVSDGFTNGLVSHCPLEMINRVFVLFANSRFIASAMRVESIGPRIRETTFSTISRQYKISIFAAR